MAPTSMAMPCQVRTKKYNNFCKLQFDLRLAPGFHPSLIFDIFRCPWLSLSFNPRTSWNYQQALSILEPSILSSESRYNRVLSLTYPPFLSFSFSSCSSTTNTPSYYIKQSKDSSYSLQLC